MRPEQANKCLQGFVNLDNCNEVSRLKDSLQSATQYQLDKCKDAIVLLVRQDSVNNVILSLSEQKYSVNNNILADEVKRQKKRARKAKLMGSLIAPPIAILGFLIGYLIK